MDNSFLIYLIIIMYLVGFDFDGVIINSKPTMERAWQDINKKFCLGNKIIWLLKTFSQ